MSELYLVRHAQASFGSDNYDQLSGLGFQQSRLLGRYFGERRLSFDHMVAGDLQRHRQTLDGICDGMEYENSVSYRIHAGLNEYHFESLVQVYMVQYADDVLVQNLAVQPSDKKAYYRLLRRVLTAWSEDRLVGIPESWSDFQQRVLDARAMLHDLAERGNRLLVVSSGGAISVFIGTVLALSPAKVFDLNLQMRNTGVSHFYFNRDMMNLSSFNAVPHLDHPEQTNLVTYG